MSGDNSGLNRQAQIENPVHIHTVHSFNLVFDEIICLILHGWLSLFVRLNKKTFGSDLNPLGLSQLIEVNPPNMYDVPCAFNKVNVFLWPLHLEWKFLQSKPSRVPLQRRVHLSFNENSHNFISSNGCLSFSIWLLIGSIHLNEVDQKNLDWMAQLIWIYSLLSNCFSLDFD